MKTDLVRDQVGEPPPGANASPEVSPQSPLHHALMQLLHEAGRTIDICAELQRMGGADAGR
jgi:hypothetical protein